MSNLSANYLGVLPLGYSHKTWDMMYIKNPTGLGLCWCKNRCKNPRFFGEPRPHYMDTDK